MSGLALDPSVTVTLVNGVVEARDQRTGFQVALDADLGPAPVFTGTDVHNSWVEFCREAGFELGLDIDRVRQLQAHLRATLMREERAEELSSLLQFAVARVPYYRERREQYERPGTPDPLLSLPLIDKSVLRLHFEHLLPEGVPIGERLRTGEYQFVSTSGTTAERVQAICDLDQVRVPPDFEAIWGLPMFQRPPRTAVLTSPNCSGATGCSLESAARAARTTREFTLTLPTTADLFALSDTLLQKILEELWEFSPDFLFVNPVYAHWVARRAKALGLLLPPIHLVISSYQFLSRIQRRALEQLLSAPVVNMYSATELGGAHIGIECKEGMLHQREDHCQVEILVGTRPAEVGEVGNVVVTTLHSRTIPLIRYVVGDLAESVAERCSCPLSDWRCFRLHGRSTEVLHNADRTLTTNQVDEVVSGVGGIDFYSCTEGSNAAIQVQVIRSESSPFSALELRRALREQLDLQAVDVHEVRRLEPAPSLKYPNLRSTEKGAPRGGRST